MNIAFWEATKWATSEVGQPITVLPQGMPEKARTMGVREFESDNGIYRFYVVPKDKTITILSCKTADINRHCGAAQILLTDAGDIEFLYGPRFVVEILDMRKLPRPTTLKDFVSIIKTMAGEKRDPSLPDDYVLTHGKDA